MFDAAGVARLREYAKGDTVLPIPGFWAEADIAAFEATERRPK